MVAESGWKGQGAKIIGNGFKFHWSGDCKAENGLGIINANLFVGKVVGGERCNDRVMKVNIVSKDVVWKLVSSHCPEAGGRRSVRK